MLPDHPVVSQALNRTLSVVRSERVVLFGRGRGANPGRTATSSWSRHSKGPGAGVALRILIALADLDVPKDVFVLRPEEWASRRWVPGALAYPADQEGVVLYGA